MSCADEFDCMGGGCQGTRIVKDLKTRIRMGRINLMCYEESLPLESVFHSSAGSIAICCIVVESVECLQDGLLNDFRW